MTLALSEEFIQEYRDYCNKYDEIVVDLFQGQQLDQLSELFLSKHETYLNEFPFGVENSTDPRRINGNTDLLIDEDLSIVTRGTAENGHKEEEEQQQQQVVVEEDQLAVLASEHDLGEQRQLVDRIIHSADTNLIIGDIYRRACQASYLRITFNKSRLNQEDNRLEAVTFARLALRYKPESFLICYWFMISLGWYLDPLSNPKERTLVSRVFQQVAIRNTKLNPRDPLAHNLLGRYYYEIAGLTWLERKLAKSLLNVKLEGSYQDAEREFLVAHELKGNWLPTGLWLARVLLAQHRPIKQIKHWIDFGLALEAREPTSEIERQQLLELRSKLKIHNQ